MWVTKKFWVVKFLRNYQELLYKFGVNFESIFGGIFGKFWKKLKKLRSGLNFMCVTKKFWVVKFLRNYQELLYQFEVNFESISGGIFGKFWKNLRNHEVDMEKFNDISRKL